MVARSDTPRQFLTCLGASRSVTQVVIRTLGAADLPAGPYSEHGLPSPLAQALE